MERRGPVRSQFRDLQNIKQWWNVLTSGDPELFLLWAWLAKWEIFTA